MEAIGKRSRAECRRESSRQGDWVCLYCTNYNYAFRVVCNRCQAQTRQRNEQELMGLVCRQEPVLPAAADWQKNRDTQNEDPMLDGRFPQVLLITPPKQYQRRSCLEPLTAWQQASSECEALGECDLNQSKKPHRYKEQAFEKQNRKWLERILDE